MAKAKTPSQKKAYDALNKRLLKYVAMVRAIYDNLNLEASKIASHTPYDAEGEKPFKFKDYPATTDSVKKLQQRFVNDLGTVIMSGTSQEWKNSNELQDLLADKVIKAYGAKRGTTRTKKYYQVNNDALKAFQQRRINGMNLSQNLWNQAENYKQGLEFALSSAIEKGMSAVTLSKRVSRYLNDFESLRKDYKARYGKAVDCHDCEYRSIRLARSEINMAYRTAEQTRWQQMDFILGYEIKLSHSHPCHDICDDLKGRYPKSFKWVGWHPNDLCYVVPIIKSEEKWWEDEGNHGTDYDEITDVPQGFKTWVANNQDRISKAEKRGTLPYFVRDNRERVKMQVKVQINNSAIVSATANNKTLVKLQKNIAERRKEIKKNAEELINVGFVNPDFPYEITLSKKGIKEWLNQPHKHYESKNELLLKIDEIISTSKYKGSLPDVNNNSISAHLFETTIDGDLSWIIVRLTPEGIARLYSITDSDKMIGLIKK